MPTTAHHYWRRPQRPGVRRLPGPGRTQSDRAGGGRPASVAPPSPGNSHPASRFQPARTCCTRWTRASEKELAPGDATACAMAASDLYTIALEENGQYITIADGTLGGPGATERRPAGHGPYHRQMNKFAAHHLGPETPGAAAYGHHRQAATCWPWPKPGLAIRRLGTR